MTVLTKIFVVALVVLSLLLAAASVTFLNTLPDYQSRIDTLEAANKAAETNVNSATTAAQAEIAALNNRVTSVTQQLSQSSTSVAELRAQIATTEAEKAALEQQVALANSTQGTLAGTVQNHLALVQQLRSDLSSLQESYTRTTQQFSQVSEELAKSDTEVTYLTQELRRALEQNKDMSAQLAQARGKLADLGESIETSPDNVPAPAINGVVLRVDNILGKPYAMISVGSEDDVRPGMRFVVSDNSGLLGFVTIEEVDDTTSIGVLSGPKTEQVKTDNDVRTQTQS